MKEDICKECGGIHCDDCGINAEPASQSELIEPLEAEPFERENRYLVLKRKDIIGALTQSEITELARITGKVDAHRMQRTGVYEFLQCVVVESDWPEYEPTWAAIEKRMRGL